MIPGKEHSFLSCQGSLPRALNNSRSSGARHCILSKGNYYFGEPAVADKLMIPLFGCTTSAISCSFADLLSPLFDFH